MLQQKPPRAIDGAIEMIPLPMLFIDRRYQRSLNALRVSRIVKNFDPRLIGVLIVSWHGDGMMAILDGQHRFEALKRLNRDSASAPLVRCLVYEDLTPEQEAILFDKLNSQRAEVAPSYGFVARHFARDPDAVAIVDTVHACGLKLYDDRLDGKGVNCLRCFTLLETVYRRHGQDHLKRVLAFLVQCWGTKIAFSLYAVAGVSLFLEHYEDDPVCRQRRAIEAISKIPYDIFLARMPGYAGGNGAGYAFALEMVKVYNRNLHYDAQLDESRITRKSAYH